MSSKDEIQSGEASLGDDNDSHHDLLGASVPLNDDLDNIFDDDGEDPMTMRTGDNLSSIISGEGVMGGTRNDNHTQQHRHSSNIGNKNSNASSTSNNSVADAPTSRGPDSTPSSLSAMHVPVPVGVGLTAADAILAGSSSISRTTNNKSSITATPVPSSSSSSNLRQSGDRSNNSVRRSSSDRLAGWQNDEHDKPYRKQLILQIANLLKERKQNPSEKWLKELPFKARKLEESLYRKAPSLKAYMDQSTLKTRLKKVAHAITSQFREAQREGSSRRSSTQTNRTAGTTIGTLGNLGGVGRRTGVNGDVGNSIQSQQAMNSSLQDQILENIRQQQRIYQNLMGSSSNQTTTSMGFSQDQLLQAQLQGAMGQQNPMGAINGMGSLASINPAAATTANMHAAAASPLRLQAALMQGIGGSSLRANSASAQQMALAANQMAMMNPAFLQNSLGANQGLNASQAALLAGQGGTTGLGSMMPPPSLGAGLASSLTSTSSLPSSLTGGMSGIDSSMPPPSSSGQTRTSSFVSSGNRALAAGLFPSSLTSSPSRGSVNGNGKHQGNNPDDLSLSPNSFKW